MRKATTAVVWRRVRQAAARQFAGSQLVRRVECPSQDLSPSTLHREHDVVSGAGSQTHDRPARAIVLTGDEIATVAGIQRRRFTFAQCHRCCRPRDASITNGPMRAGVCRHHDALARADVDDGRRDRIDGEDRAENREVWRRRENDVPCASAIDAPHDARPLTREAQDSRIANELELLDAARTGTCAEGDPVRASGRCLEDPAVIVACQDRVAAQRIDGDGTDVIRRVLTLAGWSPRRPTIAADAPRSAHLRAPASCVATTSTSTCSGRARLTGVVDWIEACVGPPEVDVGHRRLNLTVLFSAGVADRFRALYEAESGHRVDAWWDVHALLSIDGRGEGIIMPGRPVALACLFLFFVCWLPAWRGPAPRACLDSRDGEWPGRDRQGQRHACSGKHERRHC